MNLRYLALIICVFSYFKLLSLVSYESTVIYLLCIPIIEKLEKHLDL